MLPHVLVLVLLGGELGGDVVFSHFIGSFRAYQVPDILQG